MSKVDLNMQKWLNARTPKLNRGIVEGLSHLHSPNIEKLIERLWVCSSKGYPPGITYEGGRRCTAKESFLEVTKSNAPNRAFEMSTSDMYLMRYDFAFHGVPLSPRHIFLPFIRPGGLFTVRDTQYMVTPVISGRIFNIEHGEIYLPSTRLRMGFWQKEVSCILNDREINRSSVGGYLYYIHPDTKRSKLNPLLVHYLLAKFGIVDTLKFYGVNAKLGYQELDELDKSEWFVFRSKQMAIKNRSAKEYPPTELRIAISKDSYYVLICDIIASIFYILDNVLCNTSDIAELVNPNYWLRLLYFFIFKETCSENKMVEKMTKHMESMESTIDEITIDGFKRANLNCTTVFELFRFLTINFNDLCIHYDYGTMYDLEIRTIEPLTFGIRKDITNAMYRLQKIPPNNLTAAKINFVLSHSIDRDTILSVKGHGELEPSSIASTCMLYGPTADIITYSKATSSGGDSLTDLNDPNLLMHYSLLEVSSYNACTGKELSGRGLLNPHQSFVHGNVTSPSKKHAEKLALLNDQLTQHKRKHEAKECL
jgi:hypothetical protein